MSVMGIAHKRAALIEADATFDAAGETTSALAAKRARAVRNAWRRPVAAVFAGSLTLVILAGTAFAARPGGPLYGARIWTEMANLPAGLTDRAQAEVHRLDQRILEAQQASTAGDDGATEAALVAYSRIVAEAALGTDKDPAATATIEITVTRHVVVLTQMVATVPAPVRAAAEAALSSSTVALDDLDGKDGDQSQAPSGVDTNVTRSSGHGHAQPPGTSKGTTPDAPAVEGPQPAATPDVAPDGESDRDSHGLTTRPWRSERPDGLHLVGGQYGPSQ